MPSLSRGGKGRPDLGVFLDEVQVLDGDEELVVVAVAELHELARPARRRPFFSRPWKMPIAVIGVDDVVAGLEVLELGERGPDRGPADDDLLFGDDVGFGEERRSSPAESRSPGRGRRGRGGARPLVGDSSGESASRLSMPFWSRSDADLSRIAGLVRENVAAVPLPLEPAHIIQEERDPVVEPGDGLERKMEIRSVRSPGSNSSSADGSVAETRPTTGVIDASGARLRGRELAQRLVPFLLDFFGDGR